MNIQEAKICLDCDEIYDHEMKYCPTCSGRISWFLKEWIGALPKEEPYTWSSFAPYGLKHLYSKNL